jgi:hypothetical protein
MCRRGHLASLEEGALIAGVSRRRVMAWLDAAGIDLKRKRAAFLNKHRRRAIEQCEGKRTRRKPTRAQLRVAAERAKEQWDRYKVRL